MSNSKLTDEQLSLLLSDYFEHCAWWVTLYDAEKMLSKYAEGLWIIEIDRLAEAGKL